MSHAQPELPASTVAPPLAQSRIRTGAPAIVEVIGDCRTVGYVVADAAEMTPATMAFIVDLSDGFVCVAMEGAALDRLALPPMTDLNESSDGLDFAVSVDASDVETTGISARDRATTVRRLADPATTADMLSRPGHVLPVRVSARAKTHPITSADAALAAAARAGCSHAAVFAAVLGPHGEIATHHELSEIATRCAIEHLSVRLHTVGDVCATFSTGNGRYRIYEYHADGITRVAVTKFG
ncbi:3,4-dihydroxy-2-butanone-4-phosphate synthase [Mycolicibacterium mucogenicum]|uniref:3,4-dihydroxy-2-butanone-4-phosphate synthase n=1 Tax=Mycolicibacterium mucogenicum TaxID=56689 RepID=UPI002285819B|nr:3,4-dihydroxy-2-butanone-4-phosphate synthase [Mycolicibacterium mucogenicum]